MVKPAYNDITDIHCHLLPDLDDGPCDWNEAVNMVRVAYKNHIRKIICTPHWILGSSWQPSCNRVLSDVNKLNYLLNDLNIDVEVFPGMEIRINEMLPELAGNGDLLTLANSNYLLVEVPFITLPAGMEQLIYNLVSCGFIPILAHPERNKYLQSAPSRVLDYIDKGALVQITASSLYGRWGEGAMKCCHELIKLDAVFVIASDGHSADNRPPEFSKGIEIVENIVGEQKTKEILSNAEKIFDS